MGGCSKLWEGVLNRVGAVYNGRVQSIMGGGGGGKKKGGGFKKNGKTNT